MTRDQQHEPKTGRQKGIHGGWEVQVGKGEAPEHEVEARLHLRPGLGGLRLPDRSQQAVPCLRALA